jgi:hypothetical protein
MAAVLVKDKYYLRSLHEEISLVDRKIAHMAKYDSFPSEKARDLAAGKLRAQRDLLVRNAQLLIDSGIDYKASELPRSLRPNEPASASEAAVDGTAALAAAPAEPETPAATPAYEGKFLNMREEIEAYVQKRRKPTLAVVSAAKRR